MTLGQLYEKLEELKKAKQKLQKYEEISFRYPHRIKKEKFEECRKIIELLENQVIKIGKNDVF